MFAMAGARYVHNVLVNRLLGIMYREFRRPCQSLPSDMRVNVSKRGFFYPDVVALCGKPEFRNDEHLDTLLNPSVIVEVSPPSSELWDRGRKFEQYRTIDSLREYVLVSAERISIDLYTRQPDGRWLLTALDSLEQSLDLQSVGCKIPLAELYDKIDFDA